MTYAIAEPCIDEKDRSCIALPEKWLPFVAVDAAWRQGGAEAVSAALAGWNGDG